MLFRSLHFAVEKKIFREDLYYRINVVPIALPPLRERVEDIPLLVEHFLGILNADKAKQVEGISPEALALLKGHRWQGNVRELYNVIERAVVLKGSGVLMLSDLPEVFQASAPSLPLGFHLPEDGINFDHAVNEFENHLIVQALEKSGWVKNRAARLLNLNRTTLVEKIKKKKIIRELLVNKVREV